MAKTKLTKEVERSMMEELYFNNKHPVLECTIGRKGIVDILSHESKIVRHGKGKPQTREHTWRCFEIKTSKSDFYSKSKWTFVGDFNYFVMPKALYQEVKEDIPKHVGVYLFIETKNGRNWVVSEKRAKRVPLGVPESVMLHEFAVSSSRESMKLLKQGAPISRLSTNELVSETVKRINGRVVSRLDINRLNKALNKKK